MKTTLILPLTFALMAPAGFADDHTALIDQARSAAPAMISANASIMINGEIVVEGSNGWVCMPETMPGDNSPNCSDKVWMEMFKAVGDKGDFSPSAVGVSYMLAGDQGTSNSDPYHPTPKSADDFIKEGPHVMVIVPRAMLTGLTDDPDSGEPYVMWGDTPYAHIMIPVADR